jgi:pyruvate dehydrogenase E2 component (dihydrolipoamide acetyltransferase)
MPSLGSDMEAGTLVEWLVKPGDPVKRGTVMAVVETQKGAIEIEVFETGHIEQILVGTGTKVPVGTPLARIVTEAEIAAGKPIVATAPMPRAAPVVTAPPMPLVSPGPPAPLAAVPTAPGRLLASPAARRLALQEGIDLAKIKGSGPAGEIFRADVERGIVAIARAGAAPIAAPPITVPPIAPPAKPRAPGLDLAAMRVAIAAAMARSKREIPHYYLEHQVDLTPCGHWLTRTNADRSPEERLLIGALTVKATALALRRFPAFNGFYENGKFAPAADIHVGVAVSIRGGGLAAPAIHAVDRLGLDELMERMRDLVQRMRAGRIRSSEIADATITVSCLGERGVETLYGIIYPPQVAIVGFGKPVTRPWVIDGAIGPRLIVTITLAADHRVSDGHAGALFLAEIGKLLEEPNKL